MEVSRDEALAILNRWIEEQALVKCSAQFPQLGVLIRGEIVLVDGDTVRVLSSDGAEASFVLQEGCRFVLGDSRDFPKSNQLGPTIMVTFPPDDENLFVFTEVQAEATT